MARLRLAEFLTSDLPSKVFALFLAILLWGAVNVVGSQTVTVEDVPVSTVGLREDVALASPLPAVDVRIRAPRLLLRQQEGKSLLRAFVDMAGRGIGPQSGEVTVSPTHSRAIIVSVVPTRLEFRLDPVVTRSLPVRVLPEGAPADGFQVGEATVEPRTVQVRAALRRLQEVTEIPVRVPLQGVSATMEGEFPLTPPEDVAVLTEQVRVRLEITKIEELKTLGVRVVTRGTPASGYWIRSVSADPSSIAVRGSREALGDRTFLDTVAVDVDEARKLIEQAVDVALPPGVTIQGDPKTVRVRVEVVPLEGSREISASVQVEQVPDGLRVGSLTPATLQVTVRGSGEAFTRLQESDVRVVLAASGRSVGTFSVRPARENVRAPTGVGVVSVEGVDVVVTFEGS